MIIKLYANHMMLNSFLKEKKSITGKAKCDGYFNTEILIDTNDIELEPSVSFTDALLISPKSKKEVL